MRIGIFTDTYFPDVNGVATATYMLKTILEAHGHEVIIITTGVKDQRKLSFDDNILRIPGKALRFLYDYRMCFLFNKQAYKILKNIHFDVFHIQQEFGISIFGRLLSKLFKVPLVYTYHTAYENYTNYLPSIPNTRKMVVSFIRHVISMNGEVITPSKKTMHKLYNFGVDKNIAVIPTPIDKTIDVLQFTSEKRKKFREKYNIQNKRILLYLGRLAKEKNVDELLYGYNNFKKENPTFNTVFLIVGDGPDIERLKDIALKLQYNNEIIFLGKVPYEETGFYYSISDLFLSSSTSETQGLTYIEAIEYHLVVLAKYDFNLEDIIEDGISGFFYDSPEILPSIIKKVLLTDEKQLSSITNNAKNRADKLYDKELFYKRIMNIYEKAMRKNF